MKKKEHFESSKSTEKRDAIRLLNQRRKEIDDRQVTSSTVTVGDLLDLNLDDLRRNRRAWLAPAEIYVRLHLKPALGVRKASDVTSAQVNRYIDLRQSEGAANASINRELACLRRSYILALETVPPLVRQKPGIRKLEEDNVREGFLEHEQYIVMRDELPDHQQHILVIGYHLGMRRGEILKLRWDQVDWDANLIRLEKRQTKGKQARVAPLYGELRAWLEMAYSAREDECPFIVSWKGQGISEMTTAWNSARIRAVAGSAGARPSPAAARNMIRAGIPEKRAMMIAGWKTRSVLDRYDITDERDIQADGERLELPGRKSQSSYKSSYSGKELRNSRGG